MYWIYLVYGDLGGDYMDQASLVNRVARYYCRLKATRGHATLVRACRTTLIRLPSKFALKRFSQEE